MPKINASRTCYVMYYFILYISEWNISNIRCIYRVLLSKWDTLSIKYTFFWASFYYVLYYFIMTYVYLYIIKNQMTNLKMQMTVPIISLTKILSNCMINSMEYFDKNLIFFCLYARPYKIKLFIIRNAMQKCVILKPS